ncbi:MAG TPA: thioredoxin TrxC [Casimicrobiaceae bacterium]|nr:thioredoxin TrxC [Casimicrobiaceae bacterium]
MADDLHVACLACNALNRVPRHRLAEGGNCGNCKQPLAVTRPFTLSKTDFDRHIAPASPPLIVDFWADWCGPCRTMAPAFEQAAAKAAPRVRLAKLDTEAEPEIAGRFAIRSIPTLIAFVDGREVARQSGAIGLPQIMKFIETHVPAT